jgi:ethanolamine ammonia-lyase small subunit
VVECESLRSPISDKIRSVGIVSGARPCVSNPHQKGHGYCVAARISLGARVDANQLQGLGLHARFLQKLTARGVFDGLAVFYKATW